MCPSWLVLASLAGTHYLQGMWYGPCQIGGCVVCQGDILFWAVCSNQALAQRPRRDGFASKDLKPCMVIKELSLLLVFSVAPVSPVVACHKGNCWIGSWRGLGFGVCLFSYRVSPNGIQRKIVACLHPVDGIHPSSLFSSTHSFPSSLVKKLDTASQASWWRALSPVIDGPDC